MTWKKDRRDVVKLLLAGGLSLYIPACQSSNRKKEAEGKAPRKKDSGSEIEEALHSNNVTFLQKADEQFNELNQGFNLAVGKIPALIALCANTEGVAEAIGFARKQGLKVAVKSGGHSFENFSSINDGMQINLSLMNEVRWIDEKTVKIQPSCTLREMYDAILPKGRMIPAGSCGGVGVGGITLGGGYGFFARKFGLTCDLVSEATFVDGNGKTHHVKKGDDLMWALKGGGNGNFGVVTDFTFKTFPAPDSFTRHRFKAYKLDKIRTKELLQTYFKYSKNLPESCFAAFVLNYKTLVLLITNYGPRNEALDDMIDTFSALCDDASIGEPKNLAVSLKNYYGIEYPIYFKNASAGYYENYETIASSIDQVLDIVFRKRGLIYQINTLGGNINNPEFEKESCYPHRSSPYLSELQYYWDEKKDPTALLKSFDEIQNILYENGIRKQYRNYPSLGFKDWEKAYFGDGNERLQQIKRKYDPENIFEHEQSVRLG
ncbi:MAG: FAD-binding oxidoreductase [Flavobacteriales bacterium]|nr:MAG: FAD-binding oxidoreductase [Flavobacteriales bacterium]